MKYVMIRVALRGMHRDIPVIFPDIMTHSAVAEKMVEALNADHPRATVRPISAGFVSSLDCRVDCHGKSESLNMQSRGSLDGEIIRCHDYSHGLTL